MELKVKHGYVREERWSRCHCEFTVQETLLWYWHLKDNKQCVSEDTRLHLSMTESWNHPLWSPICVLPSRVSYFLSHFVSVHLSSAKPITWEDITISQCEKERTTISVGFIVSPHPFIFLFFFPWKRCFFVLCSANIAYRCNYQECFIFKLRLFLIFDHGRFWNIPAVACKGDTRSKLWVFPCFSPSHCWEWPQLPQWPQHAIIVRWWMDVVYHRNLTCCQDGGALLELKPEGCGSEYS